MVDFAAAEPPPDPAPSYTYVGGGLFVDPLIGIPVPSALLLYRVRGFSNAAASWIQFYNHTDPLVPAASVPLWAYPVAAGPAATIDVDFGVLGWLVGTWVPKNNGPFTIVLSSTPFVFTPLAVDTYSLTAFFSRSIG